MREVSVEQSNTDVLFAAKEIAAFLSGLLGRRISRKTTYYWIESGRLPVGRLGSTIIASKTKLRDHVARLAAGEG
jgi:hypothetical protein